MQANPEHQPPTSPETHIPKVSIGLLVYNGEKYIREAIDSVLAQNYTDFELVISDNASTDGTEAICREYMNKDIRIIYIRQPINMGSLNNGNYLLEHARGKYFTWLAHDDCLDNSYLEVIVKYLDEHSDVVLCSSDFRRVKNGETLRPLTLDVSRDYKDWAKVRRSLFTFSRNNSMLIYGVYRLSIMHAYNIYGHPGFRGMNLEGEACIFSKLALHGRIVALPNILRTYRVRDDSLAHIQKKHMLPRIFNSIYVSYKYHFLVLVSSKLTVWQKVDTFFQMFFYDSKTIIGICLPEKLQPSLDRVKRLLREITKALRH
jgi:glycosyltransferase involved in cell wall biosynthesis